MIPVTTIVAILLSGHFNCPFAEANSSDGHRCKWGEHFNLVEYLGLYCPFCAGSDVVAGE